MKRLLLGIDLQNDFCHPEGKLYVQGANNDLINILRLLENAASAFDEVLISMDSHFPIHIAHPSYWRNEKGEMPTPFTDITYQDLIDQKWIPQYYPEFSERYLQGLTTMAYQCTIWPPHCLIGTKGWELPDELYAVLTHWSHQSGKNFELYNKGSNPFTEHYSILKAAVTFPEAPSTALDEDLITKFETFDEIVIVGEAMDFCVASTIADIVKHAPELLQKIIILSDCMSNIIADNKISETVYDIAQKLGATLMTSDTFLQKLPA